MSDYNAKNYTEQGGEVTHIGGKLVFDEGGSVEGGLITNQADSEATTVAALKEDFNSLLAKLKASGLMGTDAVEPEPDPDTGNDTQETE